MSMKNEKDNKNFSQHLQKVLTFFVDFGKKINIICKKCFHTIKLKYELLNKHNKENLRRLQILKK